MTSFAYKLGAEEAQSRLGLMDMIPGSQTINARYPDALRNVGIKPSDIAMNALQFAAMKMQESSNRDAKDKQEGAALAASSPNAPPSPKSPPLADRILDPLDAKITQRYVSPYHETVNSANINAGYPGGGNYAF